MQQITDTSVTPHQFPPFSCKIINVGYATDIRAISVTHTGELGWVLYVPTLFAQHVYDTIVEAGKEHNLRHVGYQTLRHLRMEKFYVYWGQDIDYMTTPIECGRMFRVDFDKDFIGKEALLQQKEEGVHRRFVQLLLETHDMHLDAWPQGWEPIYRNGQYAGLTTTTAYGYTLGCQVLLGYLCNFDAKMQKLIVDPGWVTDKNANYEVMIAGKKYPAKVNLHSPKIPMLSSEHAVHYRPTQ